VKFVQAFAVVTMVCIVGSAGHEALRDPVYQSSESYVGKGGFLWIHRWARTKGLPRRAEPEAPAWVMSAFEQHR
jgi:hypothetical protein